MIRGIIFDLGSTLMRFDGEWEPADQIATANLAAFLKTRGIHVGENFREQFLMDRKRHWQSAEDHGRECRIEEALRDTLFQMGNFSTDGFLARATEIYFGEMENHWQAYPDALETLQTLKALGVRMALLSNADDVGLVHRESAKLGFAPYLDPIHSSAEEPRWRKPDPRVFHLISDAWQIAPSEIVMVGDAPRYDVLGAHRAGMRAILVDRGDNAVWQKIPDEHKDDPHIQPDATVKTLAEIPSLIGQL